MLGLRSEPLNQEAISLLSIMYIIYTYNAFLVTEKKVVELVDKAYIYLFNFYKIYTRPYMMLLFIGLLVLF